MASQQDLDQGGTNRQRQRVYMGPSIGWVETAASVVVPVTTIGTTTILLGNTLITVNAAGAVTLQLPKFRGVTAGAGAVPGQFVPTPLTIVDISGAAASNNITILPGAGETIAGQASIKITANYGAYILIPDVVNGGCQIA